MKHILVTIFAFFLLQQNLNSNTIIVQQEGTQIQTGILIILSVS